MSVYFNLAVASLVFNGTLFYYHRRRQSAKNNMTDFNALIKELRCENYVNNFKEARIDCEDDLVLLTDENITKLVDGHMGPENRIKKKRNDLLKKEKESSSSSSSKNTFTIRNSHIKPTATMGNERVLINPKGDAGDNSFFTEEFAEARGTDFDIEGSTVEGSHGNKFVKKYELNHNENKKEDTKEESNESSEQPQTMELDPIDVL